MNIVGKLILSVCIMYGFIYIFIENNVWKCNYLLMIDIYVILIFFRICVSLLVICWCFIRIILRIYVIFGLSLSFGVEDLGVVFLDCVFFDFDML